MEVSLAGKTILITGGTSALGSQFVKRALKENAKIFFTYFTNEEKARELTELGAVGFKINFAQISEIKTLAAKLKSHTSVLDGLINNAATVRDRTVQNMSDEEWNEVLTVDLKAIAYTTKEMLRFLFKKKPSKVLNVISRVGIQGGFGQANYAAAKGGLILLTKSLAKELGKKKILVNALNPGFMKSKMTDVLPIEIIERNRRESVLDEISNPEEVADFMIYLMSDKMTLASGQVFNFESRLQ